ncbi:MAG: RluA family pseudouridine synthase [Verrucomicrobiota bacterium]
MSEYTETFLIDKSRPGDRFDVFLRDKFPAASRGAMQRLIEQGHVLVNGKVVKATHTPRAGDQVAVHWPAARPAAAQPESIALDVLFEDASLLVVNKPAGLVVHPSAGHEEHTLVNALLHHCHGSLSGIGGVARPGIVHRLDKETSGCLVVAKDDSTHLSLSEQFASRTVKKIYHAIVCGELPLEVGEINAAIARHPTHRKRMAVHDEDSGRAAHTSYRVIQRLRSATLVEAQIHTGRTHQVRVHFQFLGHPLVGDDTYGSKPNQRLKELVNYAAPRVLLHAKELTFIHPVTKKSFKFAAPLPEDFQRALELLRLKQ